MSSMPDETRGEPQAMSRPRFRFETGAATHVGKVRKENEDSFLALPSSGLWAVADGMGGHVAGKLASSTVIEVLSSIGHAVSASDLLARFEDRFMRANARLREIGDEKGYGTFGTTLVALLTDARFFAVAWCGDSRAYLMRGGGIEQISRDHTEVQELLERNIITHEQARSWPGRNVITRALGVFDEVDFDLEQRALQDGDVLLICSDGLTGLVTDAEIAAAAAGERNPQNLCDKLVEQVLERGANDNVTIVAVRAVAEAETRETTVRRWEVPR